MYSYNFIRFFLLACAVCASIASANEAAVQPGGVQQKLAMLEFLHADNFISDRLYEQRRLMLLDSASTNRVVDNSSHPNQFTIRDSSRHLIGPLHSNDIKRFALIIGADRYTHYPPLQSAVNDARAIADILMSSFGFDVQLLENPDRQHLLTALSHYRRTLNNNDQFLLYYAGHGHLDKLTQRGYWLPVDAQVGNPANWVSTADINDALLALPARQALVIADSCYSGTLSSGEPVNGTNSNALKRHRSRTVITSGGLEPVLDTGANGHSVFANAFIEQLSGLRNEETLQSAFIRLQKQVKNLAKQTPQYSIIPGAGHESGEFEFHRY